MEILKITDLEVSQLLSIDNYKTEFRYKLTFNLQ